MIKKLPIGIQTFSELIEKNYVYVDKTEQIYRLIQGKYYFFSRPRRFGKSLLCSTLKSLFEGRKDLFNNLWIGKNSNHDWKQYPVITLSLSSLSYKNPKLLIEEIKETLQEIAQEHDFLLEDKTTIGSMLKKVVKTLAQKERVVILIDEYDYPILQHAHDLCMASKMGDVLKSFYSVIKDLDKYLHFVFITGVTKFSKTSIFSGLNNLNDITIKEQGSTLLGCTEDEIKLFFSDHLNRATTKLETSSAQLMDQIRIWYNGYFFEAQQKPTTDKKIYNPFSILNFFDSLKFSNYWFETGTPTFLINLIKSKEYPIVNYEQLKVTENEFSSFEVETMPLNTLLFQTGYLTIVDYNTLTKNYTLTYPNKETSESLLEQVFSSLTETSSAQLNITATALHEAFKSNKLTEIKKILTDLYITIPYPIHVSHEKYYQTAFFLALKFAGAHLHVEQATNIGRIDVVLQTATHCFIIELKYKGSAKTAIKQIERKRYYESYHTTGKKIVLIGIGFSEKLKNVKDVEWKEHP